MAKKQLNKFDLFKEFIKLKDRKPFWKILLECIHLLKIYRSIPKHYFKRYLYKKGVTNYSDYIPEQLYDRIRNYFNEATARSILDNKVFLTLFYGQFDLKLPNTLMYNHHNLFIIGNKTIVINSPDEFYLLLSDIFQKHLLKSIFIKASYGSYGGNNIYKIFAYQLLTDKQTINTIYEVIIKSGYLFQETITQHRTWMLSILHVLIL